MLTVRLTHVQFDTDFPPPYNPVMNVLPEDYSDSVEIQYALCKDLEFHYGHPVDYVEWEAL